MTFRIESVHAIDENGTVDDSASASVLTCLEQTVLELRRHENVSMLRPPLCGKLTKQTYFSADARRTVDCKVFSVYASVFAGRVAHGDDGYTRLRSACNSEKAQMEDNDIYRELCIGGF